MINNLSRPYLFMLLSATSTPALAVESHLTPCPPSPNCVSTQASASDQEHFLAPLVIKGDSAKAWSALQQAVLAQSRTRITDKTETTLHAEVTSLVFRFVDDLDAILAPQQGQIHLRSASRKGHSDLGVNRQRLLALRAALQQAKVIE